MKSRALQRFNAPTSFQCPFPHSETLARRSSPATFARVTFPLQAASPMHLFIRACPNRHTISDAGGFDSAADLAATQGNPVQRVPEGWAANDAKSINLVPSGNGPWGRTASASGPLFVSLQNYAPYGLGQAKLRQTVTGLDPDRGYRLSFFAAERRDGSTQELLDVSVNGVVVQSKINPPADALVEVSRGGDQGLGTRNQVADRGHPSTRAPGCSPRFANA